MKYVPIYLYVIKSLTWCVAKMAEYWLPPSYFAFEDPIVPIIQRGELDKVIFNLSAAKISVLSWGSG